MRSRQSTMNSIQQLRRSGRPPHAYSRHQTSSSDSRQMNGLPSLSAVEMDGGGGDDDDMNTERIYFQKQNMQSLNQITHFI